MQNLEFHAHFFGDCRMSTALSYDELAHRITELELQNKALQKYKVSFQTANIGLALINTEGTFLEVNASLCADLRYSEEELLQIKLSTIEHSMLRAEPKHHFDLLQNKRSFSYEATYRRKDSSEVSFKLTTSILQQGNETTILIVFRDISSHEQKKDFSSIAHNSRSTTDENFSCQRVNTNFCEKQGKKQDERVTHSVSELAKNKISIPTIKPRADKSLSDAVCRYPLWPDDFSVDQGYNNIAFQPGQQTDKITDNGVSIIRDLPDKELTKEAKIKHLVLTHTLENTANAVYVVNKTYDVLYSNSVMKKLFGEPTHRKCYTHFSGATKPCPWCKNDAVFSGTPVQWEWRDERNNKVYIVSESLLEDTERGPTKIVRLVDITDQRNFENEARAHNELLTTLINASPDIIVFKDGNERWLQANETALSFFRLIGNSYKGKTESQLLKCNTLCHEKFFAYAESNNKTWEEGKLLREEKIIPGPKGDNRIFDIIKVPFFRADGSRKGLMVRGRDITEHLAIKLRLSQEITCSQQYFDILQKQNKEIEDVNIAFRIVLNNQKRTTEDIQQNILAQLEKTIFPYIRLLRKSTLNNIEIEYLDILTEHLYSLGTSFIKRLSNSNLRLTKKEILIADLVRQGKNTKDISRLLSLQPRSVEAYRNKIRKKLNINNKKVTLKQYLQSTFTCES